MHKAVELFQPDAVIIDPISSLVSAGNAHEVKSMMVRLFDHLKLKGVTCLVTSLTTSDGLEATTVGISSLIDTWIQVRDIEVAAERTRGLYLIKSRGMGHSNQVREFLITPEGVNLLPVAVGPEGVLTGSARLQMEAEEMARAASRQQKIERTERDLERRSHLVEAKIQALRAELASDEAEVRARLADEHSNAKALSERNLQRTARRTRVRPSGSSS